MNEFSTGEKYVIKMLEFEGENSERDKETTKRQDKNNKKNQKSFKTQELENDKKGTDSNISTIGKSVTNIMYVEENQERDNNTTKKQDKIRENTTKEAPMDKNNAKQTLFEWYNPKEIKSFTVPERGNKKDKTFKPNTKKYLRKNIHIMAFFTPKFTIYIQSRTKRLMEIKNPDHQNKDSRKYKKLQIWKLIDIRNILYTTNEIIEIRTKTEKHKKRNISETKIHKRWKIKKLVKQTRTRYKAKKLKKLIILNYTERGKRQQFYKYCYIIFILYTVNIYYVFLHVNLSLYISVISKKSFIQNLTYIIVTFYISLQRKSSTLEYF